MRLTGSGVYSRPAPVPKMPPGLVELMEGLTRDVLRHNPPDVYEFCARHMEQLLIIRDGRAPTKRRLTLDEKIKRAQEKIREKAEQRRRKYDEVLNKYNEAIKAGTEIKQDDTSSSHEKKPTLEEQKSSIESMTKEEVISLNQEGKPVLEEEKSSPESLVETKLKSPIHHEQDLTDALEVEIFHKPLVETHASITTETKEREENIEKEKKVQNENLKAEIKHDEATAESANSNSKENLVTLDEINSNGLLEQAIINESIGEISHDPIRLRRSVDFEKNGGSKEEASDETVAVIEVLEEPKHAYENGKDLQAEVDEIASVKTINDPIGEPNDDISETTHIEKALAEADRLTENIRDTELEGSTIIAAVEQEIDNSTVFANEVLTTAPTSDTVGVDIYSAQADNGMERVGKDKPESPVLTENKTDVKINESIVADEKESYDEESKEKDVVKVNDQIPKNEQEILKEFEIIVHGNEDKPSENLTITTESVQEEKDSDVNKMAHDNGAKNNVNENKTQLHGDIKDKPWLEEVNAIVIKDLENKQLPEKTSESNLNEPKTEIIVNSDVKQKREVLADNDEKIIEAIEKLEVCNEPIEISLEAKEQSSHTTGHLKSDDKVNNIASEEPEKETATQESVPKFEFITEENSDGAITTVDKVLVEPSDVKDDNDSAPEQPVAENNTAENNLHINGTTNGAHEVPTEGDDDMQNGNESPDQDNIPTANVVIPHQVCKEKEVLPEVQDDVTSTSEPIKTDPEISSLVESSSMDDSFIDDGVDTITEVDEMKPKGKTSPKKESSMDLETAAVTIQKVFRTFLFKSRESTFDDPTGGGRDSIEVDTEKTEVDFPVPSAPLNKERRTLGISRMDTVLQTVNEEKSLSLSTDDSSLSSAATIIQAHVRGFLTRNRLNSNKTNSSSLVYSDGPSSTSLENDPVQKVNKTILNIHIVPEGEHFMSRDESLLTSMELSLDGSPPSSTNLHPLGYDKSEPRKQLKREDAIQSISPPSNNSGKLSEDSVKDMPIIDSEQQKIDELKDEPRHDTDIDRDDTPTKSTTIETVIEAQKLTNDTSSTPEPEKEDVETAVRRKRSLHLSSDEGDVVTPFEEKSSTDSDATSRLLHSGEFHDIVLPTKVSRGDTSVVREFKNVLAYFLIWNNS